MARSCTYDPVIERMLEGGRGQNRMEMNPAEHPRTRSSATYTRKRVIPESSFSRESGPICDDWKRPLPPFRHREQGIARSIYYRSLS